MAYLQFLGGPLAGKRAHLKAARISVGRQVGCTIRIDHPSVSPRHLVLIKEGDDYRIEVDSSRPPVAVNGKQIIKTSLRNGDQVQIGSIHVDYFTAISSKPVSGPLDFFADEPPLPSPKPLPPPMPAKPTAVPPNPAKPPPPPPPRNTKPQPMLDLDDAFPAPPTPPPSAKPQPTSPSTPPAPAAKAKRILFAVGLLALMIGGSLLVFRKELWKPKDAAPVVEQAKNLEEPITPPVEETHVPPVEKEKEKEKGKEKEDPLMPKNEVLPPLAIGRGESGLKDGSKIHRSKNFKSHQEAVDAAEPGDAVIFDSNDNKPVIVQKPLRDVQFLSGSATWELHADMIDCQFLFHETKQFVQHAGRMERCAFFRCVMKQTRLIYADTVSLYLDDRSPLHPKDNPDQGKTPSLWLIGFVRNVLIHRPLSGSPTADKRFDMNWAPSIRIDATDAEGDGRGTFILNPVVLGQRAWTPHQIVRGNGVTYAHLTTDNGSWADPVVEVLRGNDFVALANSFGSDTPAAIEQYALPPKKLRYHDHEEWGHDAPGPAFRGAAMTVTGYRTRIVAHGDARKPWTVGRKMTLPGFHYADGIVTNDPCVRQFATERGGLSINFSEPKHLFVMQPGTDGAEFLSSRLQEDGSAHYPREGPELHAPTFVPLKDLRINAGEFDKLQLQDMTGKPPAEIEKALLADRSIYLGAGTYEFKQTFRRGFIVGAGMEKTILSWPDTVDCVQRECRGAINCTIRGGRYGYNSQAGLGGKTGNANGLFVRTRFMGQKEAGINLHTAQFQTWQDCEFSGRTGFTHGQDKSPGVYKGDKGAAGGTTIDNLTICNCTFRNLRHRAIDLTPDSPKLGHVGVHNCLFQDVGDTALRIEGGQTHLVQLCKFVRCASQTYVPAIQIVSHGTLALGHLDVDCRGVKGNPLCVTLGGQIAMSRCTIRGLPTSLHCDGLLAADHIVADGIIETPKDSLLFQCRFKNMDLPDGVAIAKEMGFTDVTMQTIVAPPDKTPPPEVMGLKVRTVNKQRRLEWSPVVDPESGISQYIVYSGEKEVARTPYLYEPPSDIHSPVLKIPVVLTFTDPNPNNKAYVVVAVNGAGLTSDGKPAAARRVGPSRARFFNAVRDEIVIKDIINVKGKVTQIADEEGTKLPLAKVGNNGAPNVVYFELLEIPEGP